MTSLLFLHLDFSFKLETKKLILILSHLKKFWHILTSIHYVVYFYSLPFLRSLLSPSLFLSPSPFNPFWIVDAKN